MDEKTKKILIRVGALAFILIGLLIYSYINKNYYVFMIGFLIIIVIGIIMLSDINYITRIQNINEKEREVEQVKVSLKKALPLYYDGMLLGCVFCGMANMMLLTAIAISSTIMDNSTLISIIIYGDIALSLVGVVVFLIKLRQKKMLYLIENDERVSRYTSNPDEDMLINDLHRKISSRQEEYFINSKCEKIKLDNGIELYSCYSKYSNYDYYSKHYKISYYSYVFAICRYKNIGDFDIEINENVSAYLNKDNLYISKYSILPPIIIKGKMAESVCKNIEEICSEFFSKTRNFNVVTIKNGRICLGLKSARFGKCYRIFDKNKTINQTKEALSEIEEFLLQLKSALDTYTIL